MAHDFTLRVTLEDIAGERTTKTYQLQGYVGATIDLSWQAALNDAQGLCADLDNVTGCQLVGISLAAALEQDNIFNTFKNIPVDGSDVTDLLKLTVALDKDDVRKSAPHVIPSPVIDVFLGTSGASSHIPDITNQNLIDYIANFGTQSGGQPVISDGESVDVAQGSGGILSGVWGSSKR